MQSKRQKSEKKMLNKRFIEENYWSHTWIKHIKTYMKAPPRCGIWLKSRFQLKNRSILECAGGSCRDARYLYDHGFQAQGSDFDRKTIKYLMHEFPDSKCLISRQDAFSMTFSNNSFDLIFHNGFWVLFDDTTTIVKLLEEQIRVAQEYAVILVHNADNKRLIKNFNHKGKSDNLYNIKFFNRKELHTIIKQANITFQSVSIEKFGGVVDRLYGIEKRFSNVIPQLRPIMHPLVQWVVPKLYRFLPWSEVERIALILRI